VRVGTTAIVTLAIFASVRKFNLLIFTSSRNFGLQAIDAIIPHIGGARRGALFHVVDPPFKKIDTRPKNIFDIARIS
jgi:hypothetical protein